MEKIIFFCLVVPILFFVFYLGVSALNKGFRAKNSNRSKKSDNNNPDLSGNNDQLFKEISKLNNLFKNGVLTQEEFEKAKKKILEN